MKSVNYTLYWIHLVDEKSKVIVNEEFTKSFDTERHVLMFIESYKHEHERIYSMVLKDEPFYQQTPKEEFIKDVIGYVSIYTGIKREFILSKYKSREVSDARKIITHICSDMGLRPAQIHKKTGFDRGGVYGQIEMANKLMETDKNFKEKYDAISNIIKDKIND